MHFLCFIGLFENRSPVISLSRNFCRTKPHEMRGHKDRLKAIESVCVHKFIQNIFPAFYFSFSKFDKYSSNQTRQNMILLEIIEANLIEIWTQSVLLL